ncbi:MAG: ATP-binding cassette domain-containing protein [Alistipes inops]
MRRIGEGVQHHRDDIPRDAALVLNLSVIVVLWVGRRVAAGRLQVGELVSLVNYLMQILMSLMMLSMIIMNIARASASSDRVLEVLGTEPSLKDSPGASAVVRRGAVEFRNVSFRYGGGETDVLHGISFSVAPGMTVAVAGATGSGKSTLLQLVPRLYDTTGGEVLIDGTDVRDYPLAASCAGGDGVAEQRPLQRYDADNLRWGRRMPSPARWKPLPGRRRPTISSCRSRTGTIRCWGAAG